jgi:4-hydroxy-tetrahydrodipicolinate synthase
MNSIKLAGVYAAALTPLRADFSPDIEILPSFLSFLACRGCNGALLLGTTGEGPSFSPEERIAVWRSAIEVRQSHPNFHLLAGTGTPSLQETINLTQTAFELGMDGVVILPPYYYRNATQEGIFLWFTEVLQKAVPSNGTVLGYHIPHISGIPLSIDLLARLRDAFTDRFVGIKDSSGDPEFAQKLGAKFGSDFIALTGNDKLFSLALESNASGCITAAANLVSPYLRKIWDCHQRGYQDTETQSWLCQFRSMIDGFPSPAPALLKLLLAKYSEFPKWPVRPPLLPLPARMEQKAIDEIILDQNFQ